MTDNTIDSEVEEILEPLKQYSYKKWSEKQYKYIKTCTNSRKINAAAHTITNLIAQEANKARLQTAINFATRLKLEFTKRDLSGDNMPDGYRKLSNEELITKVWGELTADKESE